MTVSGVVDIVETMPLKRDGWRVITGFAGPGFAANSALMYIIRNKGFKLRAYVRSHLIPPMMLLIDGEPAQALRIYSNEEEDLLLITCETLIMNENAWPISFKLVEWLRGKGAKEFVFIEGIPFQSPTKERVIVGFSSGRELTQYGIQPAKEAAITGLNASMLDACLTQKAEWTSLLVPINLITTIDYGGAVAVIDVLNKMFKMGVDAAPLRQRDEMIQRAAGRQATKGGRGLFGSLRKGS